MEALPRHQVLRYLEKTDTDACIAYLEHITEDLGEEGPDFHDKLAELYLAKAREEQPQDAIGMCRYAKSFISHMLTSCHRRAFSGVQSLIAISWHFDSVSTGPPDRAPGTGWYVGRVCLCDVKAKVVRFRM